MTRWLAAAFALLLCAAGSGALASSFTLSSSAFWNGGTMPRLDAAPPPRCNGGNVSPPLSFSGAPINVRSYGVVVWDSDANFVHWVAYGIDPSTRLLPPGFGSRASRKFVGGRNDDGTLQYEGPFPPPGPAHHYLFTAYALDLGRDALPAGLARAAFLAAIKGHTLAIATLTGVYAC